MTDDDWNRIRREITRGLAEPDPKRRYPSIDFLVHDLRRLLNGEPIPVRRRPRFFWIRGPLTWILAVMVGILVATVIGGIVLFQYRTANISQSIQTMQEAYLEEQARSLEALDFAEEVFEAMAAPQGSEAQRPREGDAPASSDPIEVAVDAFWDRLSKAIEAQDTSLRGVYTQSQLNRLRLILRKIRIATRLGMAGTDDLAIAGFGDALEDVEEYRQEAGDNFDSPLIQIMALSGRAAVHASQGEESMARSDLGFAIASFSRSLKPYQINQRVLEAYLLFSAMVDLDVALAGETGSTNSTLRSLREVSMIIGRPTTNLRLSSMGNTLLSQIDALNLREASATDDEPEPPQESEDAEHDPASGPF